MAHRASAIVIAALVVVASATTGCAKPSPRLASSWPRASAEATVAAPAGPTTWPLTGTPRPAGARATRVALSVLLMPGPVSRQLAGIGVADVVYEWGSSDSETQVAVLLQSAMPALAGPVGVSTTVAEVMTKQYRAAPCSLGATRSPSAPKASGGAPAMTPASFPNVFGRGPAGLPSGVYLLAQKANGAIPPAAAAGQRPGRLFFSASADATQPITTVTVPVSGKAVVGWSYHARLGSYERTVQGRLQRDALSKKAIEVKNLVVMWARPAELGSTSDPGDLSITGTGQVSVFRGGVRSDGRWRATAESPPRFTKGDGAPILLAPGATWFEIIPLTTDITLR